MQIAAVLYFYEELQLVAQKAELFATANGSLIQRENGGAEGATTRLETFWDCQ